MRLYSHSNLTAPRSLSKVLVASSLSRTGKHSRASPYSLLSLYWEYVCHAFSTESLSVSLAPLRRLRLVPSLSLSLAYRLAPTESVSLPLDRRLFRSPFHARSVSFSSLPRCPCLPPLIAPIYLLRVYLSFFPLLSLSLFLSHSLSLSHHVDLARSHGAAKFGRTHAATCLRHFV